LTVSSSIIPISVNLIEKMSYFNKLLYKYKVEFVKKCKKITEIGINMLTNCTDIGILFGIG
jgi:hypothetical protein